MLAILPTHNHTRAFSGLVWYGKRQCGITRHQKESYAKKEITVDMQTFKNIITRHPLFRCVCLDVFWEVVLWKLDIII